MRLLSFGHMPTWAGGLQNSGLANVIYQLAKHISELNGANVALAATDSFVIERKDGNLLILGWTRLNLIRFILLHPILALITGYRLHVLKKKFNINESFSGLFFKRIFFLQSTIRHNPEIIHLHDPGAIWYLDLVPKSSKVCITFHGLCGTDGNRPQRKVLYDIEKELFHSDKIDAYFFICSLLVPQFVATYGENSKPKIVIYNSYDNTKFYYSNVTKNTIKKSTINLCTLASLSDIKGQFRVLQALARLEDKNRFKYFCIGDDVNKYSEKLISFAAANDVDFEYMGRMSPDNIRENLVKFDYMIMPSSSEGFGLTYLESIACGVPVILPQNIPIAFEESLINRANSIKLDDCGVTAIKHVLSTIDSYKFDKELVSMSLNGMNWDSISRQYYNEFSKFI